jgi:ADP-heptose:LPS heptosyltransferase
MELWHIGDVVLTAPFFAELRELFPEASTSLLAHGYAKELLAGTGLVDDFIETDLDWDGEAGLAPLRYRLTELARVAAKLRGRHFDIAFQCRPHIREHVLLGLSGARRRVGVRTGVTSRFLTDPIDLNANDIKVEQWRCMLEPFGGPVKVDPPTLQVSESERRSAEQFLTAHGVSADDIVVAVHPGAGVPANRWPLERFSEVIAALTARAGVRVLTFVDPAGYGAELSAIQGVVTARVGLREMMALLKKSAFLIGNDSGPMHIAGGLGVPTIAMFGRINRWYLPLGAGHDIVRAPGSGLDNVNAAQGPGQAVAEIPTSQVLDAVDRKLRTVSATR